MCVIFEIAMGDIKVNVNGVVIDILTMLNISSEITLYKGSCSVRPLFIIANTEELRRVPDFQNQKKSKIR